MSNLLKEKYLEKFSKLDWDLKEGLACFTIAILLFLFSGFWTYFIDILWLLAITADFLIYGFLLIGKFSYSFNEYLSIGKNSVFTTNSLLLRVSRIFLYGVLINVILYNQMFIFFNVMLSIFILFFLAVVSFNILTEVNEYHPIIKFYVRHENIIKILIIVSALAILGIMMRLYNIYSIGAWDEGWYASVTTNMFKSQNWLRPLYFDDNSGSFLLFDKPPLMFILGSVGIALFGYTSLAVKWPMGVLSGLMGVAGYLIFEHQKRTHKSSYVPSVKRSELAEATYNANVGPAEETVKTHDGKVVGIIFGLSMATTWFLTFYARTAYLDAAIVALTAFTALFAVKAIDHWFYGNTKRAYIYIFLTAFINMLDLLAKAWQGLIVGPSIAIYLFAKYYEYFIPRQNLYDFFSDVKKFLAKHSSSILAFTIAMVVAIILTSIDSAVNDIMFVFNTIGLAFGSFAIIGDLMILIIVAYILVVIGRYTWDGRETINDFFSNFKNNIFTFNAETIPSRIALLSSIVTLLSFNMFIAKPDSPLNTICTQESNTTCITYVPNLPFTFFGIQMQIWGLLTAIFVYLAVVGISGLLLSRLSDDLKDTNTSQNSLLTITKSYLLPVFLVVFALLNGFVGAVVGSKIFEFFYDRFFVALTEIFTTYFTYIDSNSLRLFYGELVDGSVAVIISGLFVLLAIWVFSIIVLAVVDTILRFFLKVRLFYNNFATKIIAEWSLLTPLMVYALFIGFWIWFLLFQGDIFKRDAIMLSVIGIIFAILAYLLASIYVDVLKYFYTKVFKNDVDNPYYLTWTKGINKFLIFLSVTTILIILSFYPFIAWVNYMDQYIVGHPYSIRLPGELAGVPNVPNPLSYSWLFFEYYINWRYTGKGSAYTVVDSLGGLISPLFLACLPFFVTGVYAYLKKRDYSNLAFYGSWLLVVLITFLPAKFQLNYYYLAVFFPYFGVSSYGLYWSLKKTPSSLNFKNLSEKLLLSIPIMLLIAISLLFPFFSTLNLFQSTHNLYLFIVSLLFVVGGFIVCAVLFTRSIPESFALAFIIFYLYQNLIAGGIGNTDTGFLILSAVLVAVPIYTLRDRVPLSSGIFLFLIIMTPISTTAGWVNYESKADNKFQQTAQFILSHGGNYNYSTWVYFDAGAKYAMRFYMHGLLLVNDGGGEIPLSSNSTASMIAYLRASPQLKFFVVSTTMSGFETTALPNYSTTWQYLQTNFVNVNPLLNKPSWQNVQLYANRTVLSQSELNTLGV